MGNLIRAECNCGFSMKFPQGGGFSNFNSYDMEPAYCTKCNDLVIVNRKDPELVCPKCGERVMLYDDPKLRRNLAPKNFEKHLDSFEWNGLIFPATLFLCPKCKKKTLHFISEGFFD